MARLIFSSLTFFSVAEADAVEAEEVPEELPEEPSEDEEEPPPNSPFTLSIQPFSNHKDDRGT
jgi:hypothetical protein